MNLSASHYINKISFIVLCFALVFGCGKIDKDPKITAAIVNGKAITRVSFDNEMARIKQRFQDKNPTSDEQLKNIRLEVLEILIGGELLYQAGLKKDITVKKDEIKSEMARVQEQFPETETFKNTFTEDDIRRKLTIEKFITMEFSDPTVITEEEGKKYYNSNIDDFTKPEQVMASHILVNTTSWMSPEDKEKARKKINEAKKKLDAGADFAELAREYSEDSTATKGGALGYFTRGQMVPSFDQAAFSLEKGQVSDIVESEFGFHIIKVLDKKPLVVISYEEVSDKLKAYLKQQQVQKKVDNFIKEQRAKAEVEVIISKEA